MKLEDLLKMEPQVDPAFSRCLSNNLMQILRPMSVVNRDEASVIMKTIASVYEYLRDKYLPACFSNGETTRTVMENCVRIYVECCIAAKKTEEMAKVLKNCVETGVKDQCMALAKAIPWDNAEKVGDEMRSLVCDKLLKFFDDLFKMYDSCMPSNIKPDIMKSLVQVFTDSVDDCYGKLCNFMCNPENSYQGAVFAIMKATNSLADHVKELTHIPFIIPSAKGLFLLWVKNNKPVLTEWVSRAIKVDKFEPLQAGLLHSSSVVDVSEACSQVIGQLKQLVIPDVFVWSQVTEVLLGTILDYFMQQKKKAIDVSSRYEQTLFNDDAAILRKVCIAIGNIEKGQELLGTIVDTIEEGMAKWNERALADIEEEYEGKTDEKEKKEKEEKIAEINNRFEISKRDVSESVRTTMIAGSNSIADPIRIIATSMCYPLSAAVSNAMYSDSGISDETLTKYTTRLDDSMTVCHDILSKRSFSMLLYSGWLITSDSISRAFRIDQEWNGPKKGMNLPAVRASFKETLDQLYDYFDAGEKDGLTEAQLKGARGYNETRRLLCLYSQSTESLIAIIRSLSSGKKELPPDADPQLKDTTQREVDALLKIRVDEGDLWARAYFKELKGSDDSQAVRDHFSLPPSELLLDKWFCSNGRKTGNLYLMSRHLCFDTLLSKTMTEDNGMVLMLQDITDVKEVTLKLVFKGVKITAEHCEESEIPVFSKFATAKAADIIDAINAQVAVVKKKDDKDAE